MKLKHIIGLILLVIIAIIVIGVLDQLNIISVHSKILSYLIAIFSVPIGIIVRYFKRAEEEVTAESLSYKEAREKRAKKIEKYQNEIERLKREIVAVDTAENAEELGINNLSDLALLGKEILKNK